MVFQPPPQSTTRKSPYVPEWSIPATVPSQAANTSKAFDPAAGARSVPPWMYPSPRGEPKWSKTRAFVLSGVTNRGLSGGAGVAVAGSEMAPSWTVSSALRGVGVGMAWVGVAVGWSLLAGGTTTAFEDGFGPSGVGEPADPPPPPPRARTTTAPMASPAPAAATMSTGFRRDVCRGGSIELGSR